MKVSSERYKSGSRIAVGYVNRMQILAVYLFFEEKKTPEEASALLSNESQIIPSKNTHV